VGKLLLAERLYPFFLNLLYDLPGNPVHISTTHRPSNQHGTAIGRAWPALSSATRPLRAGAMLPARGDRSTIGEAIVQPPLGSGTGRSPIAQPCRQPLRLSKRALPQAWLESRTPCPEPLAWSSALLGMIPPRPRRSVEGVLDRASWVQQAGQPALCLMTFAPDPSTGGSLFWCQEGASDAG
jgi:hypothetical protein